MAECAFEGESDVMSYNEATLSQEGESTRQGSWEARQDIRQPGAGQERE